MFANSHHLPPASPAIYKSRCVFTWCVRPRHLLTSSAAPFERRPQPPHHIGWLSKTRPAICAVSFHRPPSLFSPHPDHHKYSSMGWATPLQHPREAPTNHLRLHSPCYTPSRKRGWLTWWQSCPLGHAPPARFKKCMLPTLIGFIEK